MAETAAETMRDRGKFWAPVPDRPSAEILRDGWSARRLGGVGQTLVSGNIDAAIADLAPGVPEVGLWGLASGEAALVRIARDKALLVSPAPLDVAPGWRAGGWVATPCDDAYAVLELAGPNLRDIVGEGTAADLDAGSLSASILFAGVPALLYRTAPDVARVHVEAPLAAYVWTWLEASGG